MKHLEVDAFRCFHDDWAVLTSGKVFHYNAMTISWGSLGTLWGKDVCTVYVCRDRYTYSFLKDEDYFTVSFFDDSYREVLRMLGTESGRDMDKIAMSGLTPIALEESVMYSEAKLTLVCHKLFEQELDMAGANNEIGEMYQGELLHTMFVGEVIEIIK